MSELIVLVFRDEYRAPEVLNELRRRSWDWVGDLDDAVAVTLNQKGKAKVQMNIDPSTREAAAWARMWGSFLGATLFIPSTELLGEAVDDFALSTGAVAETASSKPVTIPDPKWWNESLCLPEDFRRDVAAVMGPCHSAIFSLIRAPKVSGVLQLLGNYGDTIIHAALTKEQEDKLQAVLAPA